MTTCTFCNTRKGEEADYLERGGADRGWVGLLGKPSARAIAACPEIPLFLQEQPTLFCYRYANFSILLSRGHPVSSNSHRFPLSCNAFLLMWHSSHDHRRAARIPDPPWIPLGLVVQGELLPDEEVLGCLRRPRSRRRHAKRQGLHANRQSNSNQMQAHRDRRRRYPRAHARGTCCGRRFSLAGGFRTLRLPRLAPEPIEVAGSQYAKEPDAPGNSNSSPCPLRLCGSVPSFFRSACGGRGRRGCRRRAGSGRGS